MKKLLRLIGLQTFAILLLLAVGSIAGTGNKNHDSTLSVYFGGLTGQIEVGGQYVGAEFHASRPLPSRISFYYPVANSIDLSTDYWRRGESQPLKFVLHYDGQVDSIGTEPWAYYYTPYSAEFEIQKPAYRCKISYRFCQNLPVMVLQLDITNISKKVQLFQLNSDLQCLLRTCQTYAEKRPTRIDYSPKTLNETLSGSELAMATFDSPETDSALVFVCNAGDRPSSSKTGVSIAFRYEKNLLPNEQWHVIQLIGSCRQREANGLVSQALKEWRKETANYERAILDYADNKLGFHLPDLSLMQTARWSRAVLASNRHYLDGQIVPMPCPAEYNFFFTHDVLLTNLGAVNFDCERVKKDLIYLSSLSKPDSILPHAYYWRDAGFQTEFCTSDNWNHLWFIILTASYLRHSDDCATVGLLVPMLQKSLNMMLENKGANDLMYAYRPDWWDIGHIYGARSYITTLMIRALREHAYIGLRLGFDQEQLAANLNLAQRMQRQLTARLWDENYGFLFNMLDTSAVDHHYYAGSLLAAAWQILDKPKSIILLKTAADTLLDRSLGIRIAMPADFHLLIDRYRFNGQEAGAPYLYINGGIWPHGIVWYALGLLAVGEADSAKNVLQHYLTLDGISRSPNGQPSFFEYRNANAASPHYGEIDKPTFLWAGGWYLHAMYQLAGLRENEWNLMFTPGLPHDWKDIHYDALIHGRVAQVVYKGAGAYFKEIRSDGRLSYSAVITRPIETLVLERGKPRMPYLAAANCIVDSVQFDDRDKILQIDVTGIPDQSVELQVISPFHPVSVNDSKQNFEFSRRGDVREITIHAVLKKRIESLIVHFGN